MNQDASAHSTDAAEARRLELVAELHALMCIGSIDELRAFRMIARRVMGKGRDSYGPLDLKRDPRNFKNERAEEKADAFWYDVLDELRQYDEAMERVECELADAEPLPPAPTTIAAASDRRRADIELTRTALMDFDLSDEEPTRG